MRSKMLLVLAALPIASGAQELNYTFVEGGYINSDIDTGPFNADGDGLGVRGSFAINEKFHAFGAHATQDLDLDLDTDQLELGVGRHWRLQENVDFIGELSWVDVDLNSPFGGTDDDGLGLGAGLRGRLNSSLELEGRLNYVDLNDSNTSLSFSGRYFLWDRFAIGGGLEFDDDDTAWNIGLRAEFGDSD